MRTDEKALLNRLGTLARLNDREVTRQELQGILPEDIAEAFQRMDLEDGVAVLSQMRAEDAAYVLVELPTEMARAYLGELPDITVAHYLDILPMDDAVELRRWLEPERFESLLQVIPQEDASEIRRLLSYPENSAGQLMTENFLFVRPETTMEGVIQRIRETPKDQYETINYVYVLDEKRHLLGLLTMKRVLRGEPWTTASEAMKSDVVVVSTTTPEEEAARTMSRYGLSVVPVLDERGRMLGIVTADDAQEVLEEAATEDVLKLGGVSGDAEAYLSLNAWQLVKRRLPWLLILFLAEFFTGTVLRHYTGTATEGGETTLAQLMLFVPLLIGAGGNAGSQVTTTITRALALQEVALRDAWRVFSRELVVALFIGTILGSIGLLRALMWGTPLGISVVVGLALPAIIVWAASVASVLPLVAKRMGADPAVLSAPFITTLVDATGLIIFFEIARRFVTL